MERRFKVGDRVTDGNYKGVITEVRNDGDPDLCDYMVRFTDGWLEGCDDEELAPANPIYEVVGVVDRYGWLNRTMPNWSSFIFIGTHLAGKRVQVTIEVLED